jgi:hypothetical protein
MYAISDLCSLLLLLRPSSDVVMHVVSDNCAVLSSCMYTKPMALHALISGFESSENWLEQQDMGSAQATALLLRHPGAESVLATCKYCPGNEKYSSPCVRQVVHQRAAQCAHSVSDATTLHLCVLPEKYREQRK